MDDEKKLNKSGDRRGMGPLQFKNPHTQEKAAATRKKNDKINIVKSIKVKIKDNRTQRVTPEVQEAIRDKLTTPEKNGKSYLVNFVNTFMDEAKNDPNSKAASYLATSIFTDKLLDSLDAELNKQMNKDIEFQEYRIRQTLYDKQQEVYDCKDNSIICISTRRAGKTELNARLLAKDILKPNHHALYINRSFDAASQQIAKPLLDTLDKIGMKYKGNPYGGLMEFDNGSTIIIGGFHNKGEIDKYRGYKFSLVIIDEIGHLRNPKALIDECIEPAMLDFGKEAVIIYTGTPPRTKKSYARDLWNNTNIRHFKWSFMDNPYIPNKEDAIERICQKHGVTIDSPFIQREYFGNMDAYDSEALIFHDYKKIDQLPNQVWEYCWIGVDWGFEDSAAVVTVVADHKRKQMYVVRSWQESKHSISDICNEVKNQLEWARQNLKLNRDIWVICDNNEKAAVYELYQTYKIPNVFTSYKYDKILAIEQLADWSRSNTLLIINNNMNKAIIDDMENMLWKRDENTDELLHEVDDEDYHGNAGFALLYVSRQFAFDVMGIDATKSAKEIVEGV